jgi:Xaa-Pro dipeptidase
MDAVDSNGNAMVPEGELRFSDAEFARRYKEARAIMEREELAALLVYGNTAAYSEVQFLSDVRTSREAMLLFPLEGEPVLFVQYFNHVPDARRSGRVRDTRWGGESTAASVAQELQRRGVAGERLGLVGPVPWQQVEALRRGLPSAVLCDASVLLQRTRLVKSDEELTHLRRGAELSDWAIEVLEREARPGISEYELVALIESAYLEVGGQTHIHYLATTSMHHPERCVPAQQPTGRVLQPGDVLITEISAHYHGYPGQILRSFTIGEPPTPGYQRLYDIAVEAFSRVAAAVRAGATAAAVLDAAESIDGAGYTICDDLVHGFGGGYLPPIIRTRQTGGTRMPSFTFEENMTIVIQPNIITADE